MEDILASIKKVIAEEKGQRVVPRPLDQDIEPEPAEEDESEEILELDQPLAPPVDLGPPLVEASVADQSRGALEQLSTVASAAPPSAVNPMEEMVREMLRPMLKQWLDENLPKIVQDHVRREISRITGRPV